MWTLLSLTLLIARISSVVPADCGQVIFGSVDGNFTGTIKYLPEKNGKPTLSDANNDEYMEFLIGCSNYEENPTEAEIVEEEYRSQFDFDPLVNKVARKSLKLSQNYNIVTNQDIIFHVEACLPEDPTICTRVQVSITYPFNHHRPQFNDIAGSAAINNAEECDEQDPESDSSCQVEFSTDFFAEDKDGDTVSYKIIPPSHLFGIRDDRNLSSLYYRGVGVSQATNIPLLIQAGDTRDLDEKTNVALVNVVVSVPSPTTPPTPDGETDSKEQLYFILMIVFVSLFGVLLLLLLLTPLILKCCRSNKILGVTGPISRKATFKRSGVSLANATFKSNSNIHFVNYDTLQEHAGSQPPSPDRDTITSTNGRIKKKSKESNRNLQLESRENNVG